MLPLTRDNAALVIPLSAREQTKTKERKFFNDVYGLSNGREWNILNVTGRVPVLPRSNHSATVFGDDLNSIFFFGGTSLHSFLDDSLVLTGIGSEKPRWVPIYTAKNPNGRRGHSVTVKSHAPNEFFLFGGQRGKCVSAALRGCFGPVGNCPCRVSQNHFCTPCCCSESYRLSCRFSWNILLCYTAWIH